MAKRGEVHVVADVADFPDGAHRVVNVGRREIGVFNVRGKYYALPNLCPHQVGPLCTGKVSGTLIANAETGWKIEWLHEGEIITCPWHAMEYHIPTGRCLAYPEIQLRTYDVWVEDGQIKLRL